MAPNIPDHYIWLSLGSTPSHMPADLSPLTVAGVFTFFAIQHVASGLRKVQSLTTVHRPVSRPLSHSPAILQEDAIKTESLLVLATSPNSEIKASATKILCERFYANEAAKELLLRDLGSRKTHVQRRAQLAIQLLRDYGVFRGRGLSHGYENIEPRVPWDGIEIWEGGVEGGVESGGLRELGSGGEEEREARRRRREAVVIHDGDGRVGEGDVWMRDREGVMSLDVGELVIDGVVH